MRHIAVVGLVSLIALAACNAGPTPPAMLATQTAPTTRAFETVDRVLTSPRCQNCHTVTDFPRQGDDAHQHLFNVKRGEDGAGAPGMRCQTCHVRSNNVASGVPGAGEQWRLAPLSMGWEGLSPSERCHHLVDPVRNGGRNGAAVIDHLKTHLVTWAWAPGPDAEGRQRTPPPVSYDTFVAAAEAWIASGATCPAETR